MPNNLSYSNLRNLNDREKGEIRAAMHVDPFFFAKLILGDPELGAHYHFRVASPPFHKEINRELEFLKVGEKLAVVAPRSHAKSTFIDLLYPLHRITYGLERFVLMISESEEQSKLNLETLGNEIEFNPKYKFFFGDRKNRKQWGTETKQIIARFGQKGEQDEMCKVMIRGTGQKVRGLKFGPYRPTLTIVDDGEGDGNTVTPELRGKFRRWLNGAVIPGSDDARFIFLGTIIDEAAYLNRICGTAAYRKGKYIIKGWKHLFYQAVLQNTEPGEYIGEGKEILDSDGIPEVLWKERKPYSWLMGEKARLKSEGDLALFYQEQQNVSSDDSIRIFRKKDMRYWDGFISNEEDIIYINIANEDGERKKVPVNIFIGMDPASSENIKADYTVGMAIAVDNGNNVYVLEYFRGHYTPMDGADLLWSLIEKFYTPGANKQPKIVNIEKTGHAMLSGYIQMLSKKHNRWHNIIPRDAIKNKHFRIKELQPRHQTHSLFIRKEHTELENEMTNYKAFGKMIKDMLDALRWAIEQCYGPQDLKHNEKEDTYSYEVPAIGNDWETGLPIYDIDGYMKTNR